MPRPCAIAGTVSIAAPLRSKVSPQDTVFVVARSPSAGRMPVAVLRLKVADLPTRFVLDDSRAMSPELPLSRFQSLSVEVLVTRSGTATQQPGDLRGTLGSVALGRDDLELVADEVVQ